jgi:hypothetical protein
MYNLNQQLWGYKVEEKLNLGVREQKRLNTTALNKETSDFPLIMHVRRDAILTHESMYCIRNKEQTDVGPSPVAVQICILQMYSLRVYIFHMP